MRKPLSTKELLIRAQAELDKVAIMKPAPEGRGELAKWLRVRRAHLRKARGYAKRIDTEYRAGQRVVGLADFRRAAALVDRAEEALKTLDKSGKK